jgi:hypothetical protein
MPTLPQGSAATTIVPGLNLPETAVAVTPDDLLPAVSSAAQAVPVPVQQGTAGKVPAVP